MTLLFWLPLLAAAAHIFEEFAWPGGFAKWYGKYHPDIAHSIRTRYLVIVNGALLLGCLSVGIDRKTVIGPAFFLTMVALLFGNGVFHVFATARTKMYSPGTITSALLYIPLGVIGYSAVLRSQLASVPTAIVAALIGSSYHALSLFNHRRRERSLQQAPTTSSAA